MVEEELNDIILKWPIRRFFSDSKVHDLEDEIIDEYRLKIYLDGEVFIEAILLPTHIEEFVLGFMVTKGIIRGPGDISSIDISEGTAKVRRIPELQGTVPRLNLLETTGSRNVNLTDTVRAKRVIKRSTLRVPATLIIKQLAMLREMTIFKRTGGTHCAILFSKDGSPVIATEDLGRHNAVDKVIGGGLMKGVDFSESWLAVSGRLPEDMVLKPALVGIPLVASVSAPTLSGVKTGQQAGITVIGFTRGGRLNCYSHPERVVQDR